MVRHSYFFLLLLFCSLCTSGQAPTRIDVLKLNITTAPTAPAKINAILDFCDQWESYNPDTLLKYAGWAKQLAVEQKDKHSDIVADYYQAVYLFQVNKLDSASLVINEIITRYRKSFPYDDMLIRMYGLKGNILLRTTKMNELMAQNYYLVKLTEEHKDTSGLARATLGIGNVNLKLKKYDDALLWYRKALALMENPLYKRKLSFIYNNIAIVFYHLSNQDSAEYYIKLGLRYSREDQNLTNLANSLFLYGGMLAEFNRLNEAEANFKEAIEVRRRIGDIFYLITDMAQLALFYADNNYPDKGIALCKSGLELAEKNGQSYANMNGLYEALAKNYLVAGDYKNYGEALSKELALKDSIYKQNSAESLAEMQAKYELQKKENIIIQQKLDLISKNYLLYSFLLLFFFTLVLSTVFFRNYRKRQKLKMQLMQQQEKRGSEIAVAEAEEAERKRIAADLHDSLGAYAASIASNIDRIYFSETENGNLIALKELRNNSQSIVAQLGDTIWALKKDALSLTAISDRLKIFIQKIQTSYPNIVIDVFENITVDPLLPPSQAFHLFQIVKEAVNNALRHSHCKTIILTIVGDQNWKVSISDNGRGMLHSVTTTEGGNGVINMKSRAREAGWLIEWQQNKAGGTQVIIESTTN